MDAPPQWLERLRVHSLSLNDVALVEQFVGSEAVIPIRSAADLQRRMAPDRRVLVVMDGDDPLCFVSVALTVRVPAQLEHILTGPVLESAPTHAIFYGITRIGFRARGRAGAMLHYAMGQVREELPGLGVFATLSPIPGFRSWVEDLLALQGHEGAAEFVERIARQSAAGILSVQKVQLLERLAQMYLLRQNLHGRPRDPVARFHTRNGACLHDILVGADGSWHSLKQSLGVMASYRYPGSIDAHPIQDEPLNAEELFRALLGPRIVA